MGNEEELRTDSGAQHVHVVSQRRPLSHLLSHRRDRGGDRKSTLHRGLGKYDTEASVHARGPSIWRTSFLPLQLT
jgi:hypothetical protein